MSSKSEIGWDTQVIQRLIDGYGYVDNETGKLHIWMGDLGKQEVTSTLENMLEYLKYLKKNKEG